MLAAEAAVLHLRCSSWLTATAKTWQSRVCSKEMAVTKILHLWGPFRPALLLPKLIAAYISLRAPLSCQLDL